MLSTIRFLEKTRESETQLKLKKVQRKKGNLNDCCFSLIDILGLMDWQEHL